MTQPPRFWPVRRGGPLIRATRRESPVRRLCVSQPIRWREPARIPAPDGQLRGVERSTDYFFCAAAFPLPGLVAPVSVVPSAVPLAVPALGVIPDEKPVWGDAAAPGLLLAFEALEFVPAPGPGGLMVLEVGAVVCAIAGVAIMAAMAIAPYRCNLMF
jgi:hypothetical protein